MRVFILVGRPIGNYERRFLEPFLSSEDIRICGALIDLRPPAGRFQRLIKNLKKGHGGYIAIMVLKEAGSIFFKKTATNKEAIENYLSRNNIPYFGSEDPYDIETTCKIRLFNPDVLLLVNGFGVIKEPLLSLCPHGVISYHPGDMRKYRGQPCGFWELYNGESEMGITLQRLSKGLDCGTPLVEKTIAIYKNDTVKSLEKRAEILSADMAYNACKLLRDTSFKPAKIAEFGKANTLPNLRQWIKFQLKMLTKRLF